jgi:hypothetical protein
LPGQHRKNHRVRLRCAPFNDFGDAGRIVGHPANPGAIKARPQEQGSLEVERLRGGKGAAYGPWGRRPHTSIGSPVRTLRAFRRRDSMRS